MSIAPTAALRRMRWLIAGAAAVALADGSIVTLALPELLHDLNTTVRGVAAVLGVYCAVVALALPLAIVLRRTLNGRIVGVGGLVLLGGASIACALAHSLTVLLVARGLQGVGAAGALPLAFDVLTGAGAVGAGGGGGGGGAVGAVGAGEGAVGAVGAGDGVVGAGEGAVGAVGAGDGVVGAGEGGDGRRAWVATAVLGTAAGPALGGVLTQAFDWRAIFVAQAPVALAGAVAALGYRTEPGTVPPPAPVPETQRQPSEPTTPSMRWRAAAFILSTAALSAVLFLLVLLLVTGWGLTPLAAAATLMILPVGALAGVRIGGSPLDRAAAGCAMLGAGVLTLAFIPLPSVWWLLAPEALAGGGIGLALPALGGELLPERTAAQSARLLALRHAGIALTLLALAPLVAGQLGGATHTAKLQGVAALLESPLSPTEKLAIAPSLANALNSDQPRPAIKQALRAARSEVAAASQPSLTALAHEGDTLVVQAATQGLRWAFVITGILGLLAGLILRPPRRRAAAAALVAGTLALPLAYGLATLALAPASPKLGRPCHPVSLRFPGGISGVLQSAAIKTLDTVACARGVSREQQILDIAGAN